MSYRVLHVTSSFPRHPDDPVAPFLLDLRVRKPRTACVSPSSPPTTRPLPLRERFGDVEIVRARYAPERFERLAYRGGLMATARDPSAALLVPGLVAALATTTRRVANEVRPDIIHAHWWLPSGLAALATRVAPVVITLHGSDVGLAERRGVGALAHAVASRAAFVAAVSDPLLQEDALFSVSSRNAAASCACPSGSTQRTSPSRHETARLGVSSRWVRASPEKGFDVLLDAVHIARRDGADVTLDIIGDGPDRAALEARSGQLGLAGAVRFLGPLPRAALYERMATAHAVVVPSRREGLGLVAVEALALGRPVIASQVGGLPEVVTAGTGLLVPPEDPAALARALQSLPLPSPPADSPRSQRTRSGQWSRRTATCTPARSLLRSGLDLGFGLGHSDDEVGEQADRDHLERGEQDQQRVRGDVEVLCRRVEDELADAEHRQREPDRQEDAQRVVRQHHAHDLRAA